MLVGRIEDNVVYDNGNVKQGMIGENGKFWACGHTYVGEAHGGDEGDDYGDTDRNGSCLECMNPKNQ